MARRARLTRSCHVVDLRLAGGGDLVARTVLVSSLLGTLSALITHTIDGALPIAYTKRRTDVMKLSYLRCSSTPCNYPMSTVCAKCRA